MQPTCLTSFFLSYGQEKAWSVLRWHPLVSHLSLGHLICAWLTPPQNNPAQINQSDSDWHENPSNDIPYSKTSGSVFWRKWIYHGFLMWFWWRCVFTSRGEKTEPGENALPLNVSWRRSIVHSFDIFFVVVDHVIQKNTFMRKPINICRSILSTQTNQSRILKMLHVQQQNGMLFLFHGWFVLSSTHCLTIWSSILYNQ